MVVRMVMAVMVVMVNGDGDDDDIDVCGACWGCSRQRLLVSGWG